MVISEFEIKRCEREVEKFFKLKRPHPHVRNQLDYGYRIEDQSVELFEIRPQWQNPENKMKIPFAKARYVKKDGLWKIYWQRQDLKWHSRLLKNNIFRQPACDTGCISKIKD